MIFLPAVLYAQYVGSGRPWTAAQSRDSLAAVNARITADSTRSDSIRAVIADSVQENTLQIHYARGLNLDLDYYFNRNVVDIACYTDTGYTGWTDVGGGTHGDDDTNYKTDAQGISVIAPANEDGARFNFATKSFAKFSDGDISTTADYICAAYYFGGTWADSLDPSYGLRIWFYTTGGNFCYTYTGAINAGWNYTKIAKSAFIGTGDWGAVYNVKVVNSTSTGKEIRFTVDNVQMLKSDGSGPNWAQRETTNGTWVNEWTVTGNPWLVEESGDLGIMYPDGGGNIVSVSSFADLSASGTEIAGSGANYIFEAGGGVAWCGIYTTWIAIWDGSGYTYNTNWSCLAGDLVHWKADVRGSSITFTASLDGGNTTYSVSGAAASALTGTLRRRGADAVSRTRSMGLSAVEHAHHATVADGLTVPLGNIGRWHNGGVLEIYIGPDSSYFTPGDTVRAR